MQNFKIFIIIFIFAAIQLVAADGLFDIYMTREQVRSDVLGFIKSDKGQNIIGQAKGMKTKAEVETKKTIEDIKEIAKIVKSVPANNGDNVARNSYGKSSFTSKGNWYKDTVYENYYK